MASLNKVFLIGNLTRDPELRVTSGGTPVTDLGLAVSESFQSSDGTRKEKTTFVDITVWGRQAETSCQYLAKGRPVMIEGSLQLDSWTNSDGEKRSRLRVRALRVQFLGRPGGDKGERPGQAPEEATNNDVAGNSGIEEDDIPF